jgi:hypothetical protein
VNRAKKKRERSAQLEARSRQTVKRNRDRGQTTGRSRRIGKRMGAASTPNRAGISTQEFAWQSHAARIGGAPARLAAGDAEILKARSDL